MIVAIAGATGFIGSRLVRAFTSAGHDVVCASRDPARSAAACRRQFALDFMAPDPGRWKRELSGVDVLINAIGILRESHTQTFDRLHALGPIDLFAAASNAGVRRVIQVSALGAEADAVARYHQSKHQADRYLMQMPIDWAVLQPSLVYGEGGSSARMFETLATLPVIILPAADARVQPVHVDDLVAAILRMAETPSALNCVLPVVGPVPLRFADFLRALRAGLGLGRVAVLPLPGILAALAARIGDRIPGLLFDSETFGMLKRGNTASPEPLQQWLGRMPMEIGDFIAPGRRGPRRIAAVSRWVAPLARLSVSAMWLIAGVVSLGPYPPAHSIALLESIGVPAIVAPSMLLGAALLDLVLGIVTLLPHRRRGLWTIQILVVILYTLVISVFLPQWWLEPFGPVAKNIPILVMLLALREMETRE